MTAKDRCQSCRVKFHPVCKALSAIGSVRAGRASVSRRYGKGRVLLDGNRVPDTFAILVSGVVKLLHVEESGHQEIVGLLFPGDYIGPSQPLIAHLVAEAATKVELCCFPRRTFQFLVNGNAAIEPALLAQAMLELDETRRWLRLLAHRPPTERIARFLIVLEQRTRIAPWEPRGDVVEMPMTRTELADYLGLSLATASRQFTRLREKGIIETRGRTFVRVKDWPALDALATPAASAKRS